MGVELDPDLRLGDARLGRLVDWWREGCARLGHLPGRQHFDPAAWPGLLSHIYLIDVLEAGRRYRWRLLGTAVTEMAGRDVTGRFMDELYDPGIYADSTRSYDAVIATRQPLRSFGTLAFAGRDYSGFESVEVPLAADGHCVDVVLGMVFATRSGPA